MSEDKQLQDKESFFSPYNIIVIGFLASLAGLMFGLDIGVMSGANDLIKKTFSTTDKSIELVVSIMMFGAALGAMICGWASAKFGRRKCLMVSAVIFILASIGCALSNSIHMLILWRFILGISIGIASTIAPLYISEIAPEKKRGSMVSTYQLMVTIGVLLAFLSDTILGYWQAWRWMFGVLAFPAIIFLIGLFFLPGSPRWLVLNKRKKEAHNILLKIRSDSEKKVKKEMQDIIKQAEHPHQGLQLFLKNSNFRRSVGLGILLQFMQQLTGINVIMYYAPRIFADMGYKTEAQLWFTVLIGVINVISTSVAIVTVDRHQRKWILYYGFAVMAFSLGMISYLLRNGHITNPTAQYFCVAMLLLFIIGFTLSAGPIIWTVCSEIQPMQGRDFGISVSTVTNWLANFGVGFTFLSLSNTIGSSNTFLLYTGFNLLFIFLTFAFVPETSKVSLETIQNNLMAGKPLRKIGR